jgi:hypothetical protein
MTETAKFARLISELERLEREAYQKGWSDAVANILAAAKQPPMGKPITSGGNVRLRYSDEEEQEAAEAAARPPNGVSTIQVIRDIINAEPGLKGAEVFRKALPLIPGATMKTMDRTGRTALARLKSRGQIHQRDKKWYPGLPGLLQFAGAEEG